MANNADVNMKKALDQLQAQYDDLAEQEPPILIDQAVLNLAKRELETQQARKKRRIGWISAFSTASLLVITLSMVLQQQPGQQQPDSPPAPVAKEQDTIKTEGAGLAEKRKQRSAVLQSIDTNMAAPAAEEQKLDVLSESEAEETSSFYNRIELDDNRQFPEAGQWLSQIRQLEKDGQKEKAEEELEAFKLAYPDYELPEDLLD